MSLTTIEYLARKERYADLIREVERVRLVKAAVRSQEWYSAERWYNRYLFLLFFTIGLNVTNR